MPKFIFNTVNNKVYISSEQSEQDFRSACYRGLTIDAETNANFAADRTKVKVLGNHIVSYRELDRED
jgi:hypothetical protein